jgi:hypothetical protein
MVQKIKLSILFLVLAVAPGPLWAAAPRPLVIGRLACAGQDRRADGLRQLAWEAVKRTSLELYPEARWLDPAGGEPWDTPLVVWSCEQPAGELSALARDRLRRFLQQGGMLWIDLPEANGAFASLVRRELDKLFPGQALKPLAPEHVIFKSFFLISRPAGRRLGWQAQALSLGGRVAVLWTEGDVLGAMSRDLLGGWLYSCEPGGENQRENSFRLAINILMYAVCLDYKDDRVHLPFILRRRKI